MSFCPPGLFFLSTETPHEEVKELSQQQSDELRRQTARLEEVEGVGCSVPKDGAVNPGSTRFDRETKSVLLNMAHICCIL